MTVTDSVVGSFEAKTHLSALLARVEEGETITITRHGRPVARLVPVVEEHRPDWAQFWRDVDAARDRMATRGLAWTHGEIKAAIAEGRR